MGGISQENAFQARYIIFLLLYCKSLLQAVVSFDVTILDNRYLSEHGHVIKGLSSVKQLSITPNFISNPSTTITRWASIACGRKFEGGSQKTGVLMKFLTVTSELTSFELQVQDTGSSPGVDPLAYPDLLDGLDGSHSTLKHLRILFCIPNYDEAMFPDLSRFKVLKILGIQFQTLAFYKMHLMTHSSTFSSRIYPTTLLVRSGYNCHIKF